MNPTKLGLSSWIIALNIILLTILLVVIVRNSQGDTFVNYPQQVDPKAPVKSDPAALTANNNYASILMFIQNNPAKSAKFIADIKSKFFEDACKVKDNIDFNNIAKFPYGMPFSS